MTGLLQLQEMTLELQKRCLDLGMIKRPNARYEQAINYSLSQYPRALWQTDLNNTSLDTVADQREYSLTGLLTEPNQLRRVWIDDSDGVPRETGRWEVHDDAGTKTLVLDEPPDGAYDITLEIWKPPAAMVSPSDTTTCDDDWLMARAMICLLGEADWTADDPQRSMAQLEYWNARLITRERQLLAERHRPGRRARTTAWRQHVK